MASDARRVTSPSETNVAEVLCQKQKMRRRESKDTPAEDRALPAAAAAQLLDLLADDCGIATKGLHRNGRLQSCFFARQYTCIRRHSGSTLAVHMSQMYVRALTLLYAANPRLHHPDPLAPQSDPALLQSDWVLVDDVEVAVGEAEAASDDDAACLDL